ncbi:MAG TPA: protease inhibitor I42 family protein [Casimicrobiaceae bacterium]|nr:protease inhibitor I42 family protein [Casimicrobiaceae bacterium]
MIRYTMIGALAAMVAGCSSTAWNEMRANPREYFNLVAPTVWSDARIDGQSITLRRGQALVVRLPEDASSGLRWQMQPLAAGALIAPVQHDYVAAPGAAPVLANASGEAVFRIRGVATGTQAVVLERRRAFEANADKVVRFDVVVR